MTTKAERTRENRLRRMAERQGLQIAKSRRRDVRAVGYGGFMLIDASTNGIVWGGDWQLPDGCYALDLDDVEAYLIRNTPDETDGPRQAPCAFAHRD
jgi:hypothetical protein